MKRNVLQWICSTMTDATSAIVLTHNIDFLFLQSIVRPRLRKCGHPKLTIFADAACAAGTYRQQRLVLDGLGRSYRVVPVEMGVGRRFHPKAILLTGPSKAVLAVGSGNLTHGGWSANREVWATYESDDDGMHAISAFRSYLETVLDLTNRVESIAEEIGAAFDDGNNPWAANLPEPAGLLGVPGDGPLLERIVTLVGNDIQEATLCAPYYDPDGEALREVSQRVSVPVRTLLQKEHIGLSASAALSLPDNVQLLCCDAVSNAENEKSRFIHAKLFAFRRPETTTLVAGSANISRAALMADGTWGNAELIAIQEVSHEHEEELLSDLTIMDESPVLPETPPSDEWDVPTDLLRVLSARFLDGVLDITFKSASVPQEIFVELNDGEKKHVSGHQTKDCARIHLKTCPKSIRLHCVFENGDEAGSEPVWVDDEASLGISVPERRIAAKIAEAAEAGSLSAKGMFEILQLLHQHLRQPTKVAPQPNTVTNEAVASPARSYSVEDVFSESFGRPQSTRTASMPVGFRESDFFAAFNAYFSPRDPGEADNETMEPELPEQDAGDEAEPEQIDDTKAKETFEKQQARRLSPEENARLRKKLLGALENVIAALGDDEFLAGRRPERIGADIAATALLLRKGLVDGMISADDFASVTHRLWSVLFFGSRGEVGALQRQIESVPPEMRASFEAAIASSRLTAALTLWCFPDWGRGSSDAIRFRYSSMVLAAQRPWLIAGGTAEEVAGELRRLSRAMPIGADFDALLVAWRNWVRAGVAFREFETAAKAWTARELASAIEVREVKRGDLLWQAGQLCVADASYNRDPKTKAHIHPLTGAEARKIVGSWLVPVASLLEDNSILKLHEGARELLLSILAEVQTLADKKGSL